MQSAQEHTANTTIMVIEAPQVLDAGGNAVPATLSVGGDTITLTLTPGQGTTYPAAAELAVASTSDEASASKAHVAHYGLADNRASVFNTSEENGVTVKAFDKHLTNGPLKIARARIIIPWETSGHRTEPGEPQWTQWLEAVKEAGLTPYITLGVCWPGTHCRVPSYRAYEAWATKFMKALVNGSATNPRVPDVRLWGTWNEPHGQFTVKEQAKLHKLTALEAADLWGALEVAAKNASCLHFCTVVAGEFAKYDKNRESEPYIKAYENIILGAERKHKFLTEVKPRFWGMHDYNDIEDVRVETKGGKQTLASNYRNTEAEGYIKTTKARFRYAHVWMSEQGVRLATLQGTFRLYGHEELQRIAAQDFLKLGSLRQVEWAYYYEYRAPENERREYDSALLKHYGIKEPEDRRPAYCVLALGKNGCKPPKAATGSAVASATTSNEGQVALTVDPQGSPTNFWLEYGTSTAYGHTTTPQPLVSTEGEQSEAVALSGLAPCTTYHYQAEAESEASEGTPSLGGDETFTTKCPATAVAAGWYHTCAVLSSGGADCWGDNERGDLGDGSLTGPEICGEFRCSTVPVPVSGIADATAIAAGPAESCAVLAVGEVDCWGSNEEGQLGDGTSSGPEVCETRSKTDVGCSAKPVPASGIANATAVSTGLGFSCALLSSGGIDCWGFNAYGQLGDGVTGPETCNGWACSTVPVPVSGITNATAITAAEDFACALLSSGAVECWGENRQGQLGDGTTKNSSTPVPVSGITDAVALAAAGNNDTCAVLWGGGVECWGANGYAQLGGGFASEYSSTPVVVQGLSGAALATGGGAEYSCAALSAGTVECWGDNSNGQLGTGTTGLETCQWGGCSRKPLRASGITSATALTGGGEDNACALLSAGGVDCWGSNFLGEAGNGGGYAPTPVPVKGIG